MRSALFGYTKQKNAEDQPREKAGIPRPVLKKRAFLFLIQRRNYSPESSPKAALYATSLKVDANP